MGRQSAANTERHTKLARTIGFVLLLASAYLTGQFGLGPWLADARPSYAKSALISRVPKEKAHTPSVPTQQSFPQGKEEANVQIRVVEEITPQRPETQATLTNDTLGSLSQLAAQSQSTSATTDTPSSTDGISVFVARAGTFMNKATAEDLAKRLTDKGVPADVSTDTRDGHSAYVVDLRAFHDKSAADAYVQSLRQICPDAWVVTKPSANTIGSNAAGTGE